MPVTTKTQRYKNFQIITYFHDGGIRWQDGEQFDYRIYKALLMIGDRQAAEKYYFTTQG